MLTARYYQDDSIESLRLGFRKGHKRQILSAPTGCHVIGTKILMHNGSLKNVEYIVPGDIVMGDDGTPRTVIHSHNGYGVMYKVTPRKGESFIVNEDHILPLVDTETGTITDISIKDWIYTNKTFKHTKKIYRSDRLEFGSKNNNLPISPWLLGVLIGDGSLKRFTQISNADESVINEISFYQENDGFVFKSVNYIEKGCSVITLKRSKGKTNDLTDKIRSLGLNVGSQYKFIPEIYRVSDSRNRALLLAGLLDTDGHYQNGGYDYVTASQVLANDIKFIARSLGLAAYVSKSLKKCQNNFTGTYFRISISGDLSRIPCVKNNHRERLQKKSVLRTSFSIEYLGESFYFGFECDGNHRYLDSNFTAHHNSGKSVIMKLMIQKSLEKGTKVLFLCERRVLVEQFSKHLDAINIDHGVYMANHWRYKPSALVQVASIQTIERMEQWPDCDIVFVDEIHACMRKSLLNFMLKFPHVKVVGSTATPFGPLIPQYFTSLTSVVTMKKLVEDGNLVPFKVFISHEIDTEGLKATSTGEWKESDLDSRALLVVGDIVNDYIKISNEIFGGYRKTICFSAGVAHGTELTNRFNEAGINAVQISYKDTDEFKKDVLDEFAKEDTDIKVVISSTILERGFDQTDVEHVILARPLRKAFSSFVQMIGRGARTHEGKELCVIQDNSGNWMRFKKDWDDFYANGVNELNSNLDIKPRKEPSKQEKEAAKCPKCSHLWPASSDTCSHCGFVREKRSGILSVPGQLIEVGDTLKAVADERRSFYHQLLSYADEKGYEAGWAAHKYRKKYKADPCWSKEREPVSQEVRNWVRSQNIAYHYAMKKVRKG